MKMGLVQSCFLKACSRSSLTSQSTNVKEEPGKKQYSWDQKRSEQKDLSQFIFENLNAIEDGRLPGEINGEQILIRNCENCNIYLFDHINTITIDDCKNCNFFVGPTKASLFMRDCSDCVLVTACGQFRTRDCRNIHVFLACPTQPIIEATSNAKFGCFQYHYEELESQFEKAGISPFNNLWWNVHDFTPIDMDTNWKLIGECYKVYDFLPNPETNEKLKQFAISTDMVKSVVPGTIGSRRRDHDEMSLVVLFSHEMQLKLTRNIIQEIQNCADIELIKTRNIQLQKNDVKRIFENANFVEVCELGPLNALQFGGPDCQNVCVKIVQRLIESAKLSGHVIYVSSDQATAASDINNLFSFADIQLGI